LRAILESTWPALIEIQHPLQARPDQATQIPDFEAAQAGTPEI
jgi:hypothetical protein